MFNPPPNSKDSGVNWSVVTIGLEFAAAIGGFAVIGYFIDLWLGTQPRWTLILLLLGFTGGSYNLYKEVRKIQSGTLRRQVRKDSGKVDPRAASAEVAAKRGRPRPTGKVNLFSHQDIDLEELDEVELDWPEEERDQVEEELRRARQDRAPDSEGENPQS